MPSTPRPDTDKNVCATIENVRPNLRRLFALGGVRLQCPPPAVGAARRGPGEVARNAPA
ncbi:MAG: hypothetical protein JWP03_4319 [Phycisphaerales bacterium]|nr:hypothetical protein [Phycisphaerales bacterium]